MRQPGAPMQRVRILEHVRVSKWRAEWIEPNPHLKDYVERVCLEPVEKRFAVGELCGAASFRLSGDEAETWLSTFTSVYPVRVLNPLGAGNDAASAWVGVWADDIARYLARRMTFGDAQLAREADREGAEAIITWNVRDFDARTAVPVVAPDRWPYSRPAT